MNIRISKLIERLKPYVAGKGIDQVAREKNLSKIVKLASNENPLGVSPKAIEAIIKTAGSSNRYAEPSAPELTKKLAARLKVGADRIVIGAGVDSLLGYIILTFSELGESLLTSMGTFTGIYVQTAKLGRRLVTVPLKDYRHDLTAMLAAITPETRIIYIANPNNPTGTIVDRDSLGDFMNRVPADVLVVLDEAYYSYASTGADYPNGLDFPNPNLIVARTFSKDYGLAGLRVGFAIGAPENIAQLAKAKLPFEPSHNAQQAALAALDDDDFLERTLEQNSRSLGQLSKAFETLGLVYLASRANFLLLVFGTPVYAVSFCEECLSRGLILRHTEPFGLGKGVRINSGTDEETQFAIEVITEVQAVLEKNFSKPAVGR